MSIKFVTETVLTAKDKTKGVFYNMAKNARNASMAVRGINKAGKNLKSMGKSMTAGVTVPIAGAGVAMTNVARNWENATLGIEKQLPDNVGAEGFKSVLTNLKNLAEETGRTRESLAGLTEDASKSNVAYKNWNQFTAIATKGAIALEMQAGKVSKSMLGIGAGFGTRNNMEAMRAMVSETNVMADTASALGSQILDATSRNAALANMAGLTRRELMGLSTSLIDMNVPAEQASTAIKAFIIKTTSLKNLAPKAKKTLEGMGIAPERMIKAFNTDFPKALKNFKRAVDDSGSEAVGNLSVIFGAEHSKNIASLLGNYTMFENLLDKAGNKTMVASKFQAEYTKQLGTFDSRMGQTRETLKNLVDTDFLNGMKAALVAAKPIIKSMGVWMKQNPELTKGLVLAAGALALIGPTMLGLGSILAITATGFTALSVASLPVIGAIAAIAGVTYLAIKHWDGIKQAFMDFTPLGIVIKNWQPMKNFVSNLIGAVETDISMRIQTMKGYFLDFTPAGLIYKHWNGLGTWITNLFGSAEQGVSGAIQNMSLILQAFDPLHIITERFSGFGNYFTGLSEQFMGFGSDILNGLKAGIDRKIGEVTASMENAASSMAVGFKDFLGIKSPSRVFMGLGGAVMAGLAVGVQGNNSVIDRLSQKAQLMQNTMSGLSLGANISPLGATNGQFNNNGFEMPTMMHVIDNRATAPTIGNPLNDQKTMGQSSQPSEVKISVDLSTSDQLKINNYGVESNTGSLMRDVGVTMQG